MERELKRALEFARDMDKKHGLCTEPSQSAWAAVDLIYHRQKQSVKRLGGDEPNITEPQSPRNARRKVVSKGRSMLDERDMKGRKYFF